MLYTSDDVTGMETFYPKTVGDGVKVLRGWTETEAKLGGMDARLEKKSAVAGWPGWDGCTLYPLSRAGLF